MTIKDIEEVLQKKVYYISENDKSIKCITESPVFTFRVILSGGGCSYYSPIVFVIDKATLQVTEETIDWYRDSDAPIGMKLDLQCQKELLEKFKPVGRLQLGGNYYKDLRRIDRVLALFD